MRRPHTGMLTQIGLLVVCLYLSGCATLSESECRTEDPYGIGQRDGQRGELPSRLLKHQEACARYGISLDSGRYRQGYQQGLPWYCTPDNGYQQGSQGAYYQGVCPPDLEPAFLREYRPAYDNYQLRQRLEELHNELEQIRLRQYDLESAPPTDSSRREHRELFLRQMRVEQQLQQTQKKLDWKNR